MPTVKEPCDKLPVHEQGGGGGGLGWGGGYEGFPPPPSRKIFRAKYL